MKQWEKRVIAFEIIYSILIRDDIKDSVISKYENVDEDIYSVIKYAINNYQDIKSKIESLLSNNWTWDRILIIDKAILIESYSEFQVLKIDRKIVIDQAIVTAKNYSDEKSYKFINSILDKLL